MTRLARVHHVGDGHARVDRREDRGELRLDDDLLVGAHERLELGAHAEATLGDVDDDAFADFSERDRPQEDRLGREVERDRNAMEAATLLVQENAGQAHAVAVSPFGACASDPAAEHLDLAVVKALLGGDREAELLAHHELATGCAFKGTADDERVRLEFDDMARERARELRAIERAAPHDNANRRRSRCCEREDRADRVFLAAVGADQRRNAPEPEPHKPTHRQV